MNRSQNDLFLKSDFGGDNPLKTMQFVFFYTLFLAVLTSVARPEQFGSSPSSKSCNNHIERLFDPDQRDEPTDSDVDSWTSDSDVFGPGSVRS